MMSTRSHIPIRLLIVEDSEDDAALLVRELERGGFDVSFRRVETENGLRESLSQELWDVIISDFAMPRYDGVQAARLVGELAPHVPFIFVSGVIGQERAVEAMRAGVRDYLRKDDLARLPAAVEREVQTARTRREARLAEAAARQFAESVVRSMPVPIATLDHDLRVVSYNPAFCALFDLRDDATDIPLRDVSASLARHERVRDALDRVIEQRVEAHEIDVTLEDGDGERYLLLSARPLPPSPTADELVLLTIEDITHQRRRLAQMMSAQRIETVGRLAGGIAHDFNNMLTVVQSFASFLLDDRYLADYTPREVGQIILEVTERSASLTSQLLAFGRQQMQRLEVVRLNEIVGGVREMIERLIGEDVRLEFDLAPDAGVVKADLAHVEQALLNLVVNAKDACAAGSTISVATRNETLAESLEQDGDTIPAGEWVVLSVEDDGCGMDAETRAHIFDPFFSTKAFGTGTGLGLPTVYGSIRQMGGHVRLSTELGIGTTVEIYLPLAGTPTRLQDADSGVSGADTQRIQILLVEDDDLVRQATARVLERHGLEVIKAAGADEALDLAAVRGTDVDVLVSDIVMPGMNGVDLAKELVRRGHHPQMKIVFISGYSPDDVYDPGELKERAAYLQKPFLPNDLVSLIRRVHADGRG